MHFLPSWMTRKRPNVEHMAQENKDILAAKLLKTPQDVGKLGHKERVIAGLSSTGSTVAKGLADTAKIAQTVDYKAVASAAVVSAMATPLAPAIIGVVLLLTFILKQKGLHDELLAGLFTAKERLERIGRIHAVVKEIAKENGINLNTVDMCNVIDSVKHKVTKFADNTTKANIENLEELLKRKQVHEAQQLVTKAGKEGNAIVADSSNDPQNLTGGSLFSGLRHWSARWLTPDDTLRKILKEVDLITSWYSIMLGEFDIFMRYVAGNSSDEKNKWKKSTPMKDLLIANHELGRYEKGVNGVNASKSQDFNVFYSMIDLQEALTDVKESINKRDIALTIRTPVGGKRKTLRHKKRRVF